MLLLKGADKNIRDNQGNRPVDLVDDESDDKLREDLKNLLGSEDHFDCLQLK